MSRRTNLARSPTTNIFTLPGPYTAVPPPGQGTVHASLGGQGRAGDGDNPAYVSWLLSQSMLADANEISQQFSGQGSMWQNPYANPNPARRRRRRARCGSPRIPCH